MMLPALLALLAAPLVADDAFTDVSHDEALRQVRPDALLLVDFTASWCPPCKKMEETTWVDAEVVAWVEEHGLAIQVDVDEEPDVARTYGIRAMPTMVLLRNGEVVDRVVGYRDADALLGWLDGVLEGRTEQDRLDAELERMREGDDTDVEARYRLAQELLRRGEDDEASGHFAWLWEHALDYRPSYYGVRLSFMKSDIVGLAARHEPTREAFTAFYESACREIEGGTTALDPWNDWIALAEIVGREEDVLAWVTRRGDTPGTLQAAVPDHARSDVADLFLADGRPLLAARVYPDLATEVEKQVERHADRARIANRHVPEEMLAGLRQLERDKLLGYHRLALLDDRDDEAERIEALIAGAHDTPATRLLLVRQALDAHAAAARHGRLVADALAAAEDEGDRILGEALLERLEAALDDDDEAPDAR